MALEENGGLESLQVLLQQNPNSLTFARVAAALLKMGRVDEAIQLCEDGLRRHPYYVTGHMVLGKCYIEKKLFDQAEKEFKRVLLFDPKYLAAHKYYGDLMREIGWDNTCEMSYRKILQIDPFDLAIKDAIEELARRSKADQMESINLRQAAKTAKEQPPVMSSPPVKPLADEPGVSIPDLEVEVRRYQPAPTDDSLSTMLEANAALEIPPPAPYAAPEADDERFSYILDDIFQDEVLDEKPPAKNNLMPPAETSHANGFELAPEKKSAGFGQTNKSTPADDDNEDSLSRADIDDLDVPVTPPAPKLDLRPVEFGMDFDEAPPMPASRSSLGISPPAAEINFDMPEKPKPAASRSTATTKLPARRPRLSEPGDNGEEFMPPLAAGDREKIVTPTLGEIYAAQGQYTKAIGVFELLSKKEPNNRHYRDKIDYLKKRLQETQNAG